MRRESTRFSVQTSNHYLDAIKAFARWLVRDRRASDSVVAHLDGGNVDLDRRQHRRDLSDSELVALFEWTRQSRPIRRISGPDREMLYLTAVYTGLRASELASLKPGSFDLEGTTATATVEAAYSKHRRQDVVPLHAELVRRLRPWLAEIPPGRRVWPGKWAKHKSAGVILKIDLAEARTAWIEQAGDDPLERQRREASSFLAYKDEDGDRADFHALRHTFITRLVKAGVKPKDAQTLARHSTITLTMDRYAHVGLHDTATAMELVPAVGPVSGTGAERLRATGTDSACTATCTELAPKPDSGSKRKGCLPVSPPRHDAPVESPQVVAMTQPDTASKSQKAEREGFEPSVGFHPHRFSRPAQSATLSPLRRSEETLEITVFPVSPHCTASPHASPSESTKVPCCRESAKQDVKTMASSVPVLRAVSRLDGARSGRTPRASASCSRSVCEYLSIVNVMAISKKRLGARGKGLGPPIQRAGLSRRFAPAK
jgi:integrase